MLRFNSVKQSALVANRPSQVSVGTPNDVANSEGETRTKNGTLELAVTDLDLADVVVLCGLPKGATVLEIRLASDDLDSGSPALLWDLGLYTTAAGLIPKDVDAYASAITLGQAATAFTDYAFEARGIEKCGQKVWQDAGDTSEQSTPPQALDRNEYFLALTVNTIPATAVAGTLSFIVEYAIS